MTDLTLWLALTIVSTIATAVLFFRVSAGMKPLQAVTAAGPLLDLCARGYTAGDVHHAFEEYGPALRERYQATLRHADLLYACAYGVACFAAGMAASHWWWPFRYIGLVFALGALCDIGENRCIAAMCAAHPERLDSRCRLASRFTWAKWRFLLPAALLMADWQLPGRRGQK